MVPMMPAEAHIRKAAELESGWNSIGIKPGWIDTVLPHLQDSRRAANFLDNLAILQMAHAKYKEAWQSSLDILVVCRSFGEEPFVMSTMVRFAMDRMAVQSLERCLAQAKMPDDLLAEAQRQLSAEAKEPLLLYALRGERAGTHLMMTNLEKGTVTIGQVLGAKGSFVPTRIFFLGTGRSVEQNHIWLLGYFNRAVELAKLPAPEMQAGFKKLQQEISNAPVLGKWLCPALDMVAQSSIRRDTVLECAIAGIGVERFRLANGSWPESFDEIIAAKFLNKMPIDHFDCKPLRYRKASDGVVVYSIGESGTYAGDALDAGKTPNTSVDRIEFRLWDEDQRRQSPRAAAKTKSDDDQQ
jgi:hypothetical protein